jgi:hypothetical protein
VTQRKPPGEKYRVRRITVPPELDDDIDSWPRGQLSRTCQDAIAEEIALDSLPDGAKDNALDRAAEQFFPRYRLSGCYAIENVSLVRGQATEEQIAEDAAMLGIPVEYLLPALQDLFDLDYDAALKRAIVLRKWRN